MVCGGPGRLCGSAGAAGCLAALAAWRAHVRRKHRPRRICAREYQEWERLVVSEFYRREKGTTEVPKPGFPASVLKEKVIAVVLAGEAREVDAVAKSITGLLPSKSVIMLYHIGKGKKDGVGYGFSEGKREMMYPAIDAGGLTNCRQKIGDTVEFESEEVRVRVGDQSRDVANQLFSSWNAVAPKKLPDRLKHEFIQVILSIQKAFPEGAVLRFLRLPVEHRVLVTSQDVKEKTGKYYVRLFGQGHEAHAEESDGVGLFAGVSEKYVNPNINLSNLELEYTTYGGP
ncbi:unnamed protein product [Prorocentrum cordatum]|uniref:FACT complex subunit n=1 Tax=Prorocentrum cordatum TaxID=2364126 RepID=A0ABN9U958_9DINO|nr:unnamed protein product [Polarella glacialis]